MKGHLMKQKIVNSVVIIIIVAVMIALLFPWPKEFNREFTGVKYQIGVNGENYYEIVKVSFIGEYHESYFGLIEDRYTGLIQIEGVDIYKENDRFELQISENKSTVITQRCFIPAQMVMKEFFYGKLYFSEELDSLVIELFDDYDSPRVNRENGFIIAAPAVNKAEAVEIAYNLIND
jgi:hypothetical protein